MMPMVMLGGYVGIILNILMPELFVTITLTLVLIFTTYETLSAGVKLWGEESAAKAKKLEEEEAQKNPEEANKLIKSEDEKTDIIGAGHDTAAEGEKDNNKQLAMVEGTDQYNREDYDELIRRESSECAQWRIHLMNAILVTITYFVKKVRGSAKETSMIGIPQCGVTSWLILAAFISAYVLICIYATKKQRNN